MTAFSIHGNLLLDRKLVPGALTVSDGCITQIIRDVRAEDVPEPVTHSAIVSPGLIDVQVNGGFGVEVGKDVHALEHLARELPSTGVTGFLATAVSSTPNFYPDLYAAFDAARDAPGARLLGLHLEGPFLSPLRPGAHVQENIEHADQDLLDALLDGTDLRVMTLAPERPGAMKWIRKLRERGVIVSLGHTNATVEEFVRGIDAGATMATHLFNAMSPFSHRAPGAVGAALVDGRVTAGLIVDGIHSDPVSIRLAIQTKGIDRVALVTDMMSAAGLSPGVYALSGRKILVDETSARLEDGTLAGSITTMDQAVRNAARWGHVTVAEALTMATEIPAGILGAPDAGRLVAGMEADLALFDSELRVQATYVRGKPVFIR